MWLGYILTENQLLMKSSVVGELAITLQSRHKMFINDKDVGTDCFESAVLGEHADV